MDEESTIPVATITRMVARCMRVDAIRHLYFTDHRRMATNPIDSKAAKDLNQAVVVLAANHALVHVASVAASMVDGGGGVSRVRGAVTSTAAKH
jgi:hypothetical protein